MLKSICALMLSAILILPLLSCQPTPEKDIVVSKNDGKLEEKLYATPSPVAPSATETAAPELPQKNYEAPEHVTGSFEGYGGRMDVQIDARVTLPDVDSIPVYSIKDRAPTQQEVDNIVKVLMGDRPLYYPDDTQTKADIEPYIIHLKKELADFKNGIVDPIYDFIVTEEYFIETIAQAEADYAAAPESIEDVEVTTEEYSKTGSFGAKANFEDGRTAYLNISEQQPIFFRFDDEQYSTGGISYEAGELDAGMSKDAALAMAVEIAKKLGATDMLPVAISKAETWAWEGESPEAYGVKFSKQYNGITINDMELDANYPQLEGKNLNYAEYIFYETLKIYVKNGRVIGVEWNAPRELGELVNENVELLPFEDIMQLFEKQMQISSFYSMDDDTENAHNTLYVQDIKLGYLPMHKKNDLDTMLLIPVWCFYGGSIYDDGRTDEEIISEWIENGDSREEIEANLLYFKEYDKTYHAIQRDPNVQKYRPLLAINAIDGSNVPC